MIVELNISEEEEDEWNEMGINEVKEELRREFENDEEWRDVFVDIEEVVV